MKQPLDSAPRSPEAPRDKGLWRDRDVAKLWTGQALALVGQQFGVLAMPLVAILTLHANATQVSLMVATANLPALLFGMVAGVLADRFRRRRIVVAADLGRAALLLSIPICAALGVLSLQQLFAIAFLQGMLDVCFVTAYKSYVPTVVPPERLPEVYAMTGATDGITRTAVPSLAGLVVQILGAPVGLSVQAGFYTLAGAATWRIRRPEPTVGRAAHESFGRALRVGLAYVWRHRLVRALAMSEATYVFFWASVQSVLLVFLARTLRLSPGAIGVIFSVGGLGGVLAALVARRIGAWLRPGRSVVVGSLLRSAGMALQMVVAFLGPLALPLLMVTRLVNAFGWTLWDVHQESTLQRSIDDRVRGRVGGATLVVTQGALALGSAVGGGLAAWIGTVPTLYVGGFGTLLAVGWLLSVRLWQLRHLPDPVLQPAGRRTGRGVRWT